METTAFYEFIQFLINEDFCLTKGEHWNIIIYCENVHKF